MAAPSAPHIYAHQDGTNIYVRWLPVDDAASYNVYVSEGGVDGVEDTLIDPDDIEADGWYMSIVGPYAGSVGVYVTALNAGAEESGHSNSKQANLMGGRLLHPSFR